MASRYNELLGFANRRSARLRQCMEEALAMGDLLYNTLLTAIHEHNIFIVHKTVEMGGGV